ncbi:cell division topological specificity factor MinE [Romeria aff. gracilis LEGE 07310]|uniref:Cell division topological specificity factor n=1 Tax=Vasconcelosia minhoensis LEGE 07310 TaxID=915328 RepID=A0A8J7A6J3_9CYAN|nr:cell division topological specificity factor MinE [Romeria gracilis]MBE9076855.1 cell division topological specificity factor MinE [Romeria aff. gracilis LEGE 07310]
MTIPVISDLIDRLFSGRTQHSRDDVKRRLQIVLAHDRLDLDPQTLERMRQEIIQVVSRYVEIDFETLEFSLETDQRVTALIANVPIRRMRPPNTAPDRPIDAELEAADIELDLSDGDILLRDETEEPTPTLPRSKEFVVIDDPDGRHDKAF